jgi:predicted metal-dependent peptidase
LIRHPAFGVLLTYLRFVEDPAAGTFKALSNGTVQYNPAHVQAAPQKMLVSLIVHAVLHAALQENLRCRGRNPATFRKAFEIAINGIIARGGLPVPGWLRDPALEDQAPEFIVDELTPISPQQAATLCPCQLPLPKPKDTTLENEEEDQENGKEQGPDVGEEGSSKPNKGAQGLGSEDSSHSILTSALIRMQDVAKDIGTDLAGLSIAIGQVLSPRISWQEELQIYFRELFGQQGRTFKRFNRRSFAIGTPLPGKNRGKGTVTIAFDLSGSVVCEAELVEEFVGELGGILKSCGKAARIILFEADVVDDFETLDILEVIPRLKGGGGTDFQPVFRLIGHEHPNALIILTDLYGPMPPIEPTYPVLWVAGRVHDDPPWGQLIELPSDERRQRR